MNRNDPNYHVGRPIIRLAGKRVLVLCPAGHLQDSMPVRDWAGSWTEARATNNTWTVECMGKLPNTPD